MGTNNVRTFTTAEENHKEGLVMKTPWTHRIAATAIIGVLCLVPLPTIASVAYDTSEDFWGTEYSLDLQADGLWIDGITHKVLFAAASDTTIKAYMVQIDRVRSAYRTGDESATRVAMDTLMRMLENRDYGIPAKTANLLFDYCNLVAPARYHDVARHHRPDRGNDTSPNTDGFADGDGGYGG
jgi:hypothetical protein